MIRAIIFDCFGVLTTDAWLPFKQQHFGHDPALFEQAGDLNKQTNSGLISYQEFLQTMSTMTGVPAPEVARTIANNVPNAELFQYITELKSQYKIGMLSNAAGDWLLDLFTSDQVKLFDATALSYQTKAVKPMPQAYAGAAEQLGVETSECVFIDDQERYVTAAREAGMQGIVYQDNEQLRRELGALLADTKD